MFFRLTDISKVYRSRRASVTALEPVSVDVAPRDFVSLIGPSGCGKSTLLAIAAGLEPPTTGTVELEGRILRHPGRERGMVFQNYTLFPWLTVRENVCFAQRLRVNRRAAHSKGEHSSLAAAADHLIAIMGLEKFADRYPRELSGGMKQRVAIARALANKPRLLLMDEPFGALDAQTREEMQELVLLLSLHESCTILFVTHDIEEALYLSNRVLVFSAHPGRIIEEITVPFPADRPLDTKLDPEFLQLKRHLLDLLHSGSRQRLEREDLLARLRAAA